MNRLHLASEDAARKTLDVLYKDLERRIIASPPGQCPTELMGSFLRIAHSQSCGKCVPCRLGLKQLSIIIDDILDMSTESSMEQLSMLESTAKVIKETADCAIGFEAADMVLRGI